MNDFNIMPFIAFGGLGIIIYAIIVWIQRIIKRLEAEENREDLEVGDVLYMYFWDDNPYRRHIFTSIIVEKIGKYVKYMYTDGKISDNSIYGLFDYGWNKWETISNVDDEKMRLKAEQDYKKVKELYEIKYLNKE